jgi:c-di-GMP-binding flagellar brake protein YcgR
MARYFLGTEGTLLIERRTTPRYDVELDVQLTPAAGGAPIRGTTKDISELGVQVVLPGTLPEGGIADFSCAAFGGRVQAIWSRAEGTQVRIGLRFISLAPRERDALFGLIASLRRDLSTRRASARV